MKNENTIHAYRYGFLKIGLPYIEGENEPWLIFTHEDGESIKVRAYRSSDNECSVNFYPEKPVCIHTLHVKIRHLGK